MLLHLNFIKPKQGKHGERQKQHKSNSAQTLTCTTSILSGWYMLIVLKVTSLALSTLTRFQTKTELFCSVFKKICVQTYRFHPSTLLWKRFYTLSAHAQMNSAHAHFNISAREIGAILDSLLASVRHFGYSRSNSLAPGRVLMTSPFSDSIVFSVHTRKQHFQKVSFSNRSTLESVSEWFRFRWSFSAL